MSNLDDFKQQGRFISSDDEHDIKESWQKIGYQQGRTDTLKAVREAIEANKFNFHKSTIELVDVVELLQALTKMEESE